MEEPIVSSPAGAPPTRKAGVGGSLKRKAEEPLAEVVANFQATQADLEMTVEQFLTARVDAMKQVYLARCERITKRLRQRFDEYSNDMMQTAKETLASRAEAAAAPAEGAEAAATKRAATKKAKKKAPSAVNIVLECTDGNHKGAKFALTVKSRRVCRIGRSTGKQFTSNGVSLPDDLEVSTTHGKFTLKGGKVMFTDVGSSNGSELNGTALEKHAPVALSHGDALVVGTTTLSVQFEYAGGASEPAGEGAGSA